MGTVDVLMSETTTSRLRPGDSDRTPVGDIFRCPNHRIASYPIPSNFPRANPPTVHPATSQLPRTQPTRDAHRDPHHPTDHTCSLITRRGALSVLERGGGGCGRRERLRVAWWSVSVPRCGRGLDVVPILSWPVGSPSWASCTLTLAGVGHTSACVLYCVFFDAH